MLEGQYETSQKLFEEAYNRIANKSEYEMEENAIIEIIYNNIHPI